MVNVNFVLCECNVFLCCCPRAQQEQLRQGLDLRRAHLQEREHLLLAPEHWVPEDGLSGRPESLLELYHVLDEAERGRRIGHAVQVVDAGDDVGLAAEALAKRVVATGQHVVVDAA